MRSRQSHGLPRLAAAIVIMWSAGTAKADSASGFRPSLGPSHSLDAQRPAVRPADEPYPPLDDADRLATLQAVSVALDSVGDGGAYVWRRGHGQLNGTIRPTLSFKAATGEVCRHLIIRLNSGSYWREAEGIACRDGSGVWSLSG